MFDILATKNGVKLSIIKNMFVYYRRKKV